MIPNTYKYHPSESNELRASMEFIDEFKITSWQRGLVLHCCSVVTWASAVDPAPAMELCAI